MLGGVISKENEQVFKHCDSFVVLSSDEEKKDEWLRFGEKLGLECLGCLDSSLKGQEEIYSREPYIQGKIVGLERGEILEPSSVVIALVSDIIRKSKYAEKNEVTQENLNEVFIDDTDFGFELGYGKEILTENDIPIKKVKWPAEALPSVYNSVQKKVVSGQSVKINGVRANFVLCAMCKAIKSQGIDDISAYDIRLKQYIPIKNIPKKKSLKEHQNLSFNIIESKENVFIDIDIIGEKYTLEDYNNCILPKINENKNLYLSGRLPLWLLASISNSYDSSKIFTFQPGKGFTCVSSKDEKELGMQVDGIDGININQYFEDKKEKAKTTLPIIPESKSIFSSIKRLFNNIKGKHENSKYVDEKITAMVIPSVSDNKSTANVLQNDNNNGRNTQKEETNLSQASTAELSPDNENIDIGG